MVAWCQQTNGSIPQSQLLQVLYVIHMEKESFGAGGEKLREGEGEFKGLEITGWRKTSVAD